MRRASLLAVVTAVLLVLAPTAAVAAWHSSGSGNTSASATSVNQGNAPSTTRNAGAVSLSWTASTLTNGAAVGRYDVLRHVGASTTTVCSGVTVTSCSDSSPFSGAVSYGVVPRIGANWVGAESSLTSFTYAVDTTTTLGTSGTPSVVGQTVTYTATVAATSGTATPTGAVTFKDGASNVSCTGANPATLNGSGVATCALAYSATGNHSITADFPGSTGFNSSGSTVTTQAVNKIATTTALVSDVAPNSRAG